MSSHKSRDVMSSRRTLSILLVKSSILAAQPTAFERTALRCDVVGGFILSIFFELVFSFFFRGIFHFGILFIPLHFAGLLKHNNTTVWQLLEHTFWRLPPRKHRNTLATLYHKIFIARQRINSLSMYTQIHRRHKLCVLRARRLLNGRQMTTITFQTNGRVTFGPEFY